MSAFRWESLDEFSDLLNRIGRHGFRSWPTSPNELRSELETLRLEPESDVWLVRTDGKICGYALALAENDVDRLVVSLGILDECSGQVGGLLDLLREAAKARGVSLIHVAVRGAPAEPLDQLTHSGFTRVAANLELVLQREDAGGVPDPSLPEAMSVRKMRSTAEALLLTRVQNRVFEGHWGFSKNTPDEVLARLGLPSTGPEQVLFVETEEGDIAGYIWTALSWEHDHTCGKIWMTGVVPEFRSLGLGKALVSAGVKHLLSQGAADVHLEVVEGNAAAVSIYQGMGFKRHGQTDWYEKRV